MAEELMSMRDAYGEFLIEAGKDKNVVVLDADVSSSTQTKKFAAAFPERFFNMGIAEQSMMDTAAGLSLCGKTVFASSFAMFASGKAWEMVRNTIAHDKLNVKIIATHAGVTVGEDGSSHQALEDIALMRVIPNMTVIVPADYCEAKACLQAAARMRGPVYVRIAREKCPVVLNADYKFNVGKAVKIKEGNDVSIIACGVLVAEALRASEALAKEGISARVVDVSTLKPVDTDTIIRCAGETGAIVTAEEHSIIGGLGGAVAEVLGDYCPVPLVRVGTKDVFGQSGKAAELLEAYGLTASHITEAAKAAIIRKR